MSTMLLWLIFGGAFFLSMMAFAIILPIKPTVVQITERFVCERGSKMDVQIVKHSYHRPGERGIVVTCRGNGESKYVNAKAFLTLWLLFFIGSLPIAIVVGVLISVYVLS